MFNADSLNLAILSEKLPEVRQCILVGASPLSKITNQTKKTSNSGIDAYLRHIAALDTLGIPRADADSAFDILPLRSFIQSQGDLTIEEFEKLFRATNGSKKPSRPSIRL